MQLLTVIMMRKKHLRIAAVLRAAAAGSGGASAALAATLAATTAQAAAEATAVALAAIAAVEVASLQATEGVGRYLVAAAALLLQALPLEAACRAVASLLRCAPLGSINSAWVATAQARRSQW